MANEPRARASGTALRLPTVSAATIRSTRHELDLTRAAFADRLGINRRTLERWEQGRSRPGREASALILLVRAFHDTLERLASIARPVARGAGGRRRTGKAGARVSS